MLVCWDIWPKMIIKCTNYCVLIKCAEYQDENGKLGTPKGPGYYVPIVIGIEKL